MEVAFIKAKRSFFNLDETYNQAVAAMAALDPDLISRHAEVSYDKTESCFTVEFINRQYRVYFPGGKVLTADGSPAPLYFSIIILHYLITADGSPLAGQWVSYRHLPGGDIYIEPFRRRAIEPFLKTFGDRPEDFTTAAAALGGYSGSGNGISMVIPVMSRVLLNFVLWPGDEELPPSASILFDSRASSYLPTEDYAHLPAVITGEMKAQLG